jgi:hypothetical protein
MTQLELFPRQVINALRDKSKDRRWSPERDEFRRDCARRRKWGLKRRHAEKLCRLHGCSRRCMEVGIHDPVERIPPLIWDAEATCTQRPSRPVDGGGEPRDGASSPARLAETAMRTEDFEPGAGGAGRAEGPVQAERAPETDAPVVADAEVVGSSVAVDFPGGSSERASHSGRTIYRGSGTARRLHFNKPADGKDSIETRTKFLSRRRVRLGRARHVATAIRRRAEDAAEDKREYAGQHDAQEADAQACPVGNQADQRG